VHLLTYCTPKSRANARSSLDKNEPETMDSIAAMDSMDSIAGVEPGNQDGQAKGRMSTSVAPHMEPGATALPSRTNPCPELPVTIPPKKKKLKTWKMR
jgi:hypothetical protein